MSKPRVIRKYAFEVRVSEGVSGIKGGRTQFLKGVPIPFRSSFLTCNHLGEYTWRKKKYLFLFDLVWFGYLVLLDIRTCFVMLTFLTRPLRLMIVRLIAPAAFAHVACQLIVSQLSI